MPYADKEKDREYQRGYRARNTEKRIAYGNKYHLENKDEQNRKRREYYANNRERLKEKVRKYKENNPEKVRESQRKYYKHRKPTSPKTMRDNRIMNRYGLTPDSFSAMLRGQGGVCEICKTSEWGAKGPHIDHDHETGNVRGILCSRCNLALGLFRDNSDMLLCASNYLSRRG